MGFVVVSVLLCFSFIPFYLTLVESIDIDGNHEKNTLRPETFQSPWRVNITDEGTNIVSHVSPSLYHNKDIRFFTYWTKDLKSRGCYNSQCTGFVPASGAELVPGQAIAPPSIYGKQDHYIRLSVNKDPHSGDWVIYRHDLEKPSFLGHFPEELCLGTTRIQAATGFVNYLKNARGPPMGSGNFPNDDDKKSAYFRRVKFYNSKGQAFDPFNTQMVRLVDRPDSIM
ncbi:uncharacterized protein LOC123397901 isoform X2 [Hordeum vulgare subsp. vulgare]|uniref:uncharacterized protein LOC123397901 isoform X2 n=1 Tax=Hordeum vulgare subsp. vulgare TaxID=112509 RepID=UPI001D1A594F|nr:uncharacterized protein LOC123397901 isoform X2 [Hordeum vulgare subsp. vulgare]